MVGLHPRNATHPGSKWHHPRLYKTSQFPLSMASMELGEQWCRPLSVVDNVPSSSSSLSSWPLHVCKGWVKGGTPPADTSCQWEQPCSRKSSLLQTMPSSSRPFHLLPRGDTARDQLSKFPGPCLPLTQGPLSRPGFGDWKLSLEFISGASLASYIILPGPAPHDTGATLSIQSLHGKMDTTTASFSGALSLSGLCFSSSIYSGFGDLRSM